MKKKLLLIILCGVCLIGVTGCGANTKAKITDNNGDKVEKTANDLLKIHEENSANFEKKYEEAKIDLTSNVEKVSTDMGGWIYNIVYLENNWEIVFPNDYDLADIEKGAKLHIVGKIVGKDPENDEDRIAVYGLGFGDEKEEINATTFDINDKPFK